MSARIAMVAAATAVAACGLSVRGEGPPGPEGTTLPDAAPGGADAAAIDTGADAQPSTTCVTFANGIAPFVYEGDSGGYTTSAQGVTLAVSSGKAARLHNTFSAPKFYSRTKVDVHLGIFHDSGSWGGDDGDYTVLLQMFHGATRDSATSSRMDVTMAQNVIELNTFVPILTTRGLNGMEIPGADTHLVVDAVWAASPDGEATVSQSVTTKLPSTWTLENLATTATPATDKLTVVLGGVGVNAVPTLRILVFDVCVVFDP